MNRRVLPATLLAAVATLVACFELSGPPSDLSAISPLRAAWPSVVFQDVLRDENGAPAPLQIDAYDGDGNLVTDAEISFIVLDRGLRVDSDGTVHGDSIRRTTPARVVAQVRRGGDVLQTDDLPVDVVPRPDSIAPGQDTTFEAKTVEPFQASPISTDIVVKVLGRVSGQAPEGIRSWIVRYDILRYPEGVNGQRTALFTAGMDTVSADTTDTSGEARRTVTLQTVLLTQNVTGRQDVVVRVTVANTRAGGAPTVFTVTLPFDRQ